MRWWHYWILTIAISFIPPYFGYEFPSWHYWAICFPIGLLFVFMLHSQKSRSSKGALASNNDSTAKLPEVLSFKSNRAAFEYCCKFTRNELYMGATIPALIEEVSAPEAGIVLIAHKNGGRRGCYMHIADSIKCLGPGDFVAFRLLMDTSKIEGSDSFLSLQGDIVAKLKPDYHLKHKGWINYDVG